MKNLLRSSPVFALFAAVFQVCGPELFAVDFDEDVEPILRKKCFKCHSGPRAKGGLRMDNKTYFQKKIAEEDGIPIFPGHPEKSLMVRKTSLPRTDTDAMPPPTRGEPLSAVELGTIKKWITEGAKLEKTEGTDAPTTPDTDPKPAADMTKLHTWTNTEGNSLKAAFVKLDGRNVVLKKEDGSEFSYPMSSLAAESRKLATDLSTAQ